MRVFSSKILLFGEYTVIQGGHALALPYPHFSGHWSKTNAPAYDWNMLLRFLQSHQELEFDADQLEKDLQGGAGFISNIPQGKGLGSSGALVAALYNEYSKKKSSDLSVIKKGLSGLEAYYHGQSSGVDPLVSWVGSPILLNSELEPQVVEMPLQRWSELDRWFLYDSEVARHSAPLISVFKQKVSEPKFQLTLDNLNELVTEGIDAYEHVDEAMMGQIMLTISQLQFEAFQEMIPPSMHAIWLEGLKSKSYALKLCGAGGGGYFIGYRLKTTPSGVLKF